MTHSLARHDEENQLASRGLPEIEIDVSREFVYVGRVESILRELALVERFMFADHWDGEI